LQKEEFEEFRATVLPHLRELTVEYVESPEFDELIVSAFGSRSSRSGRRR
jgi:hypothetical protein